MDVRIRLFGAADELGHQLRLADTLNAVDQYHAAGRVVGAADVGEVIVEHLQLVYTTGEVRRPVAFEPEQLFFRASHVPHSHRASLRTMHQ